MGLTALPVIGKQKSEDLCRAFIKGAPRDAKGVVIYGVDHTNVREFRKVLKSGVDWYCIDNSYFDSVRGKQFRVTKNAFQVRGARDLSSTGARFANLNLRLAPWQDNPHGHWLAVEQSLVFMDCMARDPKWLEQTVAHLPGNVKWRRWNANKPKVQETLPAALRGARGLVTYASAAAVTATLLGVPSIVSKNSALHSMERSERLQFLNVLADNQWSLTEIQEGVAWQWLNRSK